MRVRRLNAITVGPRAAGEQHPTQDQSGDSYDWRTLSSRLQSRARGPRAGRGRHALIRAGQVEMAARRHHTMDDDRHASWPPWPPPRSWRGPRTSEVESTIQSYGRTLGRSCRTLQLRRINSCRSSDFPASRLNLRISLQFGRVDDAAVTLCPCSESCWSWRPPGAFDANSKRRLSPSAPSSSGNDRNSCEGEAQRQQFHWRE